MRSPVATSSSLPSSSRRSRAAETREFSRFRDDQPKFAALNAEIVGISVDPPERNLAWTKHLGLPFRLLSDLETLGRVSRLYGVWDDTWNLSQRVTFIVDRGGRVRYVEIGGLAIETDRTLAALQQLAQKR